MTILGYTLDANSNKIINLTDGSASGDAVNYGQLAAATGKVSVLVEGDGATTLFPPIIHGLVGPSHVQLWKVAPGSPFIQAVVGGVLSTAIENDPTTGTAIVSFTVAPAIGEDYNLIVIG